MNTDNRGNILFLILLAVVLFATLAYAVTSSIRGGGKDASGERMDTIASQIIQNANLMENTIQRAMLVDGIPEYGFDFSGGVLSGINNPTAPNSLCQKDACKLFSGGGEKISLPSLPSSVVGSSIPAFSVYMIRGLEVGSPADDVVATYRFLNASLCVAINRVLNSRVDPASAIESWGWAPDAGSARLSGSLTALPTGYATIGNEYAAVRGQHSFCFRHSSGDEYNFLHVLIAR